ncbi:MAG: class I SAM-dependent methyltransferase [Chloroflexi bacterium]|nr:class I SAM-dependent methyltransferase [Chloroflexota bacterium]
MDEQDLIEQWKQEEQQTFLGWNFSYLQGRYFEPSLPWSYEERVRALLATAGSVLDMGTGGGEKLLEFKDWLPAHTVATEGWPPNVPVARENLQPYGIRVVPYDIETEARMPFADRTFALVINRHEAFDAFEVARILQPEGVFLTQQVDGRSMADLSSLFGLEPSHLHVTLAECGKEVEQAGLVVEFADEAMGNVRFADVGALVYYAHAAPWDFPADFSVERYATQLLELHTTGRLSFTMGHFIIQARKPSN